MKKVARRPATCGVNHKYQQSSFLKGMCLVIPYDSVDMVVDVQYS